MTRALICTGVLGGGTAVVFALALAVSVLFPQGTLVSAGWNGGWNGGWAKPMLADDVMVRGGGWAGDGEIIVEQAPPPDLVEPAIPAPAPVEAES
jgi:hypothetical protein